MAAILVIGVIGYLLDWAARLLIRQWSHRREN
jgi:ABC-type nitrate/sulfonate/bicarbonate transport system permease component